MEILSIREYFESGVLIHAFLTIRTFREYHPGVRIDETILTTDKRFVNCAICAAIILGFHKKLNHDGLHNISEIEIGG